MLNFRQRGEIWYVGGTVKVGKESVVVGEFSTGCRSKHDARAVAATEEARIRADLLDGGSGRKSRLTLADCFVAYLRRPLPVQDYDKLRIGRFSNLIGDYRLSDLTEAWNAWLASRQSAGPATLARERAILQSAINTGCVAHNALPAPKVPGVKQARGERVANLTDSERTRLLASYNRSAGRCAKMLAYQGMRTSEVTQLRWRAVDLRHKTIRVIDTESKSAKGRTLPMHPVVYDMLVEMHAEREAQIERDRAERINRQPFDHVFLSSRGEPYTDTRKEGGNPLTKAHNTACKRADVRDFHPHDWRHDWATRMVRAGVDLISLQRLGGWSDIRMVARYASFALDHLREAIMKIA